MHVSVHECTCVCVWVYVYMCSFICVLVSVNVHIRVYMNEMSIGKKNEEENLIRVYKYFYPRKSFLEILLNLCSSGLKNVTFFAVGNEKRSINVN